MRTVPGRFCYGSLGDGLASASASLSLSLLLADFPLGDAPVLLDFDPFDLPGLPVGEAAGASGSGPPETGEDFELAAAVGDAFALAAGLVAVLAAGEDAAVAAGLAVEVAVPTGDEVAAGDAVTVAVAVGDAVAPGDEVAAGEAVAAGDALVLVEVEAPTPVVVEAPTPVVVLVRLLEPPTLTPTPKVGCTP
jgi:hypothetical protein